MKGKSNLFNEMCSFSSSFFLILFFSSFFSHPLTRECNSQNTNGKGVKDTILSLLSDLQWTFDRNGTWIYSTYDSSSFFLSLDFVRQTTLSLHCSMTLLLFLSNLASNCIFFLALSTMQFNILLQLQSIVSGVEETFDSLTVY